MARYVLARAPELEGYRPDAQIMVEMSPYQFLAALGEAGEYGTEGFYVVQSSLDALKARMVEGLEIDPLFIDYDPTKRGLGTRVLSHEGRHRAQAAIELGIPRVPVVVYFYDEDELHDVTNREGRVYDESHYIPVQELGDQKVQRALDYLMARRISPEGWYSESPNQSPQIVWHPRLYEPVYRHPVTVRRHIRRRR